MPEPFQGGIGFSAQDSMRLYVDGKLLLDGQGEQRDANRLVDLLFPQHVGQIPCHYSAERSRNNRYGRKAQRHHPYAKRRVAASRGKEKGGGIFPASLFVCAAEPRYSVNTLPRSIKPPSRTLTRAASPGPYSSVMRRKPPSCKNTCTALFPGQQTSIPAPRPARKAGRQIEPEAPCAASPPDSSRIAEVSIRPRGRN